MASELDPGLFTTATAASAANTLNLDCTLAVQNAEASGARSKIPQILPVFDSAGCMSRITLAPCLRFWIFASLRGPLKPHSSYLCITADAQNSKSFARAVKAVKVKLVTVSKGNSKGTEIVAGEGLARTCMVQQKIH